MNASVYNNVYIYKYSMCLNMYDYNNAYNMDMYTAKKIQTALMDKDYLHTPYLWQI